MVVLWNGLWYTLRLAGWGVQIALGLALGVVVVEVLLQSTPGLLPLGFRVFYDFKQPYTQFDEEFVVRGIPNLQLTVDSHPEYVMHVNLNEYGFRDPVSGGEVQALVLGDSFIFGTGVEHEQSFCEQLKRLTGQTYVNLAIGSYGPAHHVRILQEDGQRFTTKQVLLMLSMNDIEDCGRFKEWRDRPYPRVPKPASSVVAELPAKPWPEAAREAIEKSLLSRLIQWNLTPTQAHRNFQAPLRHREGQLDLEFNESILYWADPEQGATPQNWELYDRALDGIQAWAEPRGVEVIAMIVPTKEEAYRSCRLQAGGSPEFDQTFQALRDKMLTACGQRGFRCLDLTEPLRSRLDQSKEQAYYCWDGHWNPRGHELAAELAAEFLAHP